MSGFMSMKSIPLRFRLTPIYRDRLLAYADSERWSIALAAQVIIEEFLDKRDAAPATSTPHAASKDYAILCRVLKKEVAQHGVLDANGRQVVDAKLVSAAFRAARVGEGRPDKVGNHWAAFSKNLARLAAEGVAERDSWTIRVLRLP